MIHTKSRSLFFALFFCSPCMIMSKVTDIQSEEQLNQLLNNSQQVVLKFYADWCGHCVATKKPYQDLSENSDLQDITFAQIDVEAQPEISKKYDINAMPTFIYLKNSNVIEKQQGTAPAQLFIESMTTKIKDVFGGQGVSLDHDLEQENKQMMQQAAQIPGDSESLFDKIKGMLLGAFEFIKRIIMMIIDKITGVFR